MLTAVRGRRGMAVAPHALAAQSALEVLRQGGNAIEATIAGAATIAVAYPHMNSIGGDSFWLMHVPGEAPGAIDACGGAAYQASIDWYRAHGIEGAIPFRGGLAANTVAGTVGGWGIAHELSRRALRGRMPFARLLEDAIYYARHGVPVTVSQAETTARKAGELRVQPGFAQTFLARGKGPDAGVLFTQPRLAVTLERIARRGADDFYRGELARSIAKDLSRLGSPVSVKDLDAYRPRLVDPLSVKHSTGTLYNMTPPTQGLVSLLILSILDELRVRRTGPLSPELVHLTVEATKQAFGVRDRYIEDPRYMTVDAQRLLARSHVRELASKIHRRRAAPWGAGGRRGRGPGDTVWLGVVDEAGRAVSFIQSIYHEFGCGAVLDSTGINWQNRGCSFSLDQFAVNALLPGKKPFHTLNPALAVLKDGRTIVYGSMGGDGQPQTQAAIFTRIVDFEMDPQAAINAPRWLLGRTWGDSSESLKLESRFEMGLAHSLMEWGHEVEILAPYDESVGHAGAIVRHRSGVLEGGADPRSDGGVAAY
ncbi:MAG TPA: gamma-glutamyltransferase family protein [Burkholderiales bacterium]|nr:gamma-glutamyltransferase family protein [Burkholderiales bacterium]